MNEQDFDVPRFLRALYGETDEESLRRYGAHPNLSRVLEILRTFDEKRDRHHAKLHLVQTFQMSFVGQGASQRLIAKQSGVSLTTAVTAYRRMLRILRHPDARRFYMEDYA